MKEAWLCSHSSYEVVVIMSHILGLNHDRSTLSNHSRQVVYTVSSTSSILWCWPKRCDAGVAACWNGVTAYLPAGVISQLTPVR